MSRFRKGQFVLAKITDYDEVIGRIIDRKGNKFLIRYLKPNARFTFETAEIWVSRDNLRKVSKTLLKNLKLIK